MHGEHFDVAIIGSSRGWWNIDMNAIREKCGLRAGSLANNHFRDPEVLLSLKVFLANGNRADHILMQEDHDNLSVEADHFSSTVYDFLPYLEDSLVSAHLQPHRDALRSLLALCGVQLQVGCGRSPRHGNR